MLLILDSAMLLIRHWEVVVLETNMAIPCLNQSYEQEVPDPLGL